MRAKKQSLSELYELLDHAESTAISVFDDLIDGLNTTFDLEIRKFVEYPYRYLVASDAINQLPTTADELPAVSAVLQTPDASAIIKSLIAYRGVVFAELQQVFRRSEDGMRIRYIIKEACICTDLVPDQTTDTEDEAMDILESLLQMQKTDFDQHLKLYCAHTRGFLVSYFSASIVTMPTR